MVKQSGKVTVKKRLITVESSEEETEDITYAELSDDDYTTLFERETINVTEKKIEESFLFGDVGQGDFVLVKLAGKKSMGLMEMNVKSDIASGLRTPINLSLTKKINVSLFPALTYKVGLLFHDLYQQDHPNGKGHSCVFQWISMDRM
jgi:hypothetical protein